MFESLSALFAANQFFSGGVVLGALGLLAVWLRDVPRHFWSVFKRNFISTLTFDNRDELMFATLVEYMNAKDVLRGINQFTVRGVRQSSAYSSFADDIRQGAYPETYLSPGEGFHIFTLDGRFMWMTRELQVVQTVLEKITLSTFGRDKKPLEEFIRAALAHRISRELNKIAIYVPNPFNHSDWMRAKLGNNRKLASIVLKAGQTESILADLSRFFASRDRYETLGIPWRRGYLLYGSPGTGKTSLVTAIASELSLNVCSVSLASSGLNDDRVNALLSSVPPRSIILIEDIDSFFRQREQANAQTKLSFSGFINALDGVASHEGSVVFMTTNFPELIDDAVIRSGRVDFRMELSRCDQHQLRHMFLKFFDVPAAAEAFASALEPGRWSPAEVQERLLKATDAQSALQYFQPVPAAAA
ncbi:MAG: AAA family ATPase [Burkholderiales bacterium]